MSERTDEGTTTDTVDFVSIKQKEIISMQLQSEGPIKEPPANVQRKKKIIMKNINKTNEKPASHNNPKNTWVKKTKKSIDLNKNRY